MEKIHPDLVDENYKLFEEKKVLEEKVVKPFYEPEKYVISNDPKSYLDKSLITRKNLNTIKELNLIAKKRGQTLSQMAIAWVLNNKAVTTALIGARTLEQVKENIKSLDNLKFSNSELKTINQKAKDGDINIWSQSSSY